MESFFLDLGFEVVVFPLTQLTEASVPSDFLYLDTATNKIFGFQFKVLYRNGDDHWKLYDVQHKELARFDWMYYGLSDLKAPRLYRNALRHLRIVSSGFPFQRRLSVSKQQQNEPRPYFRWATFFRGLRSCKHGRRIRSRADLRSALWPDKKRKAPREIGHIADEVFIANLEARRVVRYSSGLAPRRRPGRPRA